MTAFPLARRTRRTLLVGAMCTGLAAGLAACGDDPDAGTNGVGRLEPGSIRSRTVEAARSADAVRLAGTVVSGGKTYRLDMRLKDEGGTGSVTTGGTTFGLLRVDEHLYLKAGADFWSHSDDAGARHGAGAGDALDGKYVKVPAGDPSYKRLSTFTDKDVLLDGLLTLHGTLAKGERGTSAGVRTIALTGDDGSGGTLDVSLEGTAYPMRLERAGGAGTLQLTEWGKDFALDEPTSADTVDYGKQLPES
ncbi:hypothetical protein [Streptomyces sp. NPDC088785]|uniref:hypothetical protein n=1 Tax=Streptomyces sp. NPDC088785 TaxID=3365897 RepID=UPI003802E207